MDTRFKATKPEEIQMTMTITATLGEWMLIRRALEVPPNWPCRDLDDRIRAMVSQAEKNFVYFPPAEDAV